MRWWGPRGFTMPSHRIDVRPGGAYRFCMRGAGRRRPLAAGRLSRDRRARAAGLHLCLGGRDRQAPRPETLVTVTFAEEGGKTRLTLRQAVFESVTARDAHQQGWSQQSRPPRRVSGGQHQGVTMMPAAGQKTVSQGCRRAAAARPRFLRGAGRDVGGGRGGGAARRPPRRRRGLRPTPCRASPSTIHGAGLWRHGSDERQDDAHLRPIESRRSGSSRWMPGRSLWRARRSDRIVGVCRHFALLLVRTPAGPGRAGACPSRLRRLLHLGQVRGSLGLRIVERRAGALDTRRCAARRGAATGFHSDFDPLDVPRDRFIIAADAWRMCRAGRGRSLRFVPSAARDVVHRRQRGARPRLAQRRRCWRGTSGD